MSISFLQSLYLKSCSLPPTIAGSSARSLGTVQSNVILENGACVPQREGVFTPYINASRHFLTSSYERLSVLTNGARYVSNDVLKQFYSRLYELNENTCACPSLAYILFYPELVSNKVPYFVVALEVV